MSEPVADPALARVILRARAKREERGAGGDGMIVIPDLAAEEALALDGLLSPRRRKPVLPRTTLRVSLSVFEAAMRSGGMEPRDEYERVGGHPVRDLPAERAARREQRSEFRTWLMSQHGVVSRPAVAEWFEEALRQGRVHEGVRSLVARALDVLGALPAPRPVQRTVLAVRVLDGDPHALDVGTPLHGLLVSLLTAAAGLEADLSPRDVWAAWNVLADPVSSNVAALNLPLAGRGPAAAVAAGVNGCHVVLTFGQLAASELRWPPGVPCFSCENPSVLIAAEQALGESCPPLVCTSGRPSDAVRLLFSTARRAGVRVRHHGDFDEAGVQILRDLQARYGAVPWRFDAATLYETIGSRGHDPTAITLEEAVTRLPRPLAEESVIEDLISDLREVNRAGR